MTSLTDQQKKALSRKANISVTAGAGTGKTMLLVERYIDILLKENADVREILAITFTKKAAAEMNTRVADLVEERLKSEPDNAKRQKFRRILDRLNSASISTIHSFCARLLRDFPLESGLDPDFRQISEMQQQILVAEAIQNELDELDNNPEEWLDLYRLFGEVRIREMLGVALEQRFEMRALVQKFENTTTGNLFNLLLADFDRYVKKEIDHEQVDRICLNVAEICSRMPDDLTDNTKAALTGRILLDVNKMSGKKGMDFWQALFAMADHFTTTENKAYTRRGSFGPGSIWGEDLESMLLALSEMLVPVIQKKITVPGNTDRLVLEQLKTFYRLYSRVENRYSRMKNELAMVDFDDLQIIALDLLRNNEPVRSQLTAQYRFIMVDEFQDTNMLQWEIIRHVGALESNKFFIVGDPKQSIYGFRNADIRVFNDVKNSFIAHNKTGDVESDIVLGESFRFTPRIGQFVNDIFSRILQSSDVNPWDVDYHHITTRRKTDIEGLTEFHFFAEDDQSEFIAARVIEMRDEYDFGKMAVLLRTRNHLTELEEIFRRKNIPFRTLGGIGFYQRQEIYDIYHLIRFLINPDDDNALVATLRSPLTNLSDEGLYFLAPGRDHNSYWARICTRENAGDMPEDDFINLCQFRDLAIDWLACRDHVQFHELLYRIFQESGYKAALAAQIQGERYTANLEKILALAADYENNGFISLTDFADSLQNLIHKHDKESEAQTDFIEENSVKIMTIHQAKGLQFDVVFLPYLEQELRGPAGNQALFDEELGLVTSVNNFDGDGDSDKAKYYLMDLVRHRQHQKELAELKRLFYVGCTRARDHLIMTARCKNNKFPSETAAAWLSDILRIDPESTEDGALIHNVRIGKSIPVSAKLSGEKRSWRENLDSLAKMVSRNAAAEEIIPELLPVADHPEGEIFSATQIMTFDQDPDTYLKRYHYGFFADDYDIPSDHIQSRDKALLTGKLVHKLLENPDLFDCERVLFDLGVSDPIVKLEAIREVDHVRERIKKSEKLTSILGAREYRNEVSILMKLGTDYLNGTIDRMYRDEESVWQIVDYKTNHISSGQVEETAQNYRIQMDVYALLLSCVFPEQSVFPVTLYFTHPDQLSRTNYSRSDLESAGDKISALINRMKQYDPYVSGTAESGRERFAFTQDGK